jgi:hypothetical protein
MYKLAGMTEENFEAFGEVLNTKEEGIIADCSMRNQESGVSNFMATIKTLLITA